jgi:hypothetical protein
VAIPAIVIALIVVVSNLVYQRVKGPLNTNVIAAVARIEQHYGLVPGEAFDLLQSDERARLAQARDSIEKANWALEFKNFVGIVWGATILERLKQLETAETRKSAQDYERERVPVELLTGDVVGFAKAMTGDSAISVGAVAFWPNETSSAEKLLGGLAVNLATGGFVGDLSSKAQPFGIIALSATTLWRIEVGYVFNGIELSHASRIKTTGVIGWKRSELRTRRVNDSRHLHLVVSIPSYHSTTAKTVGPDLSLFFPDEFDEAQRRHPFFARVMANRSASVGIAEELRQS